MDVCFVVPEPDWMADYTVPCSDPHNGASPRCDGDDWVPGRQGCICSQIDDVGKMGRKWLTGIRAAAGKSGGAKQLCASQSSYAQPFGEGCQRPAAPTWARNEEEASLLHTRKGLMRRSRKVCRALRCVES
ncbi:hypothetical protein PMIN06_004940 [Paraphaeosphaeria minitans]